MSRRREEIREALRRRVANGVHLGFLRPGQRLTSAHEVARQHGTDYRVVTAAARSLEQDGLLEVRARAGIFVGRNAARPDAVALAGLGSRLVSLLVEEIASGLPATGFPERVRHCLETVRVRAACVECNQDQLDSICLELCTNFGLDSAGIEIDQLRTVLPASLRQADCVITTSFHAGEVRRVAETLGKPCIIVTLDPAWRAEIMRLLAERPVYFIGIDPRWAAKARAIWGDVAGASNLHPLTLGCDSLEGIPAEAAVMLMPGARHRLAGTDLLERALPPRGFSRESTREILSVIVQANVNAWMDRRGA